MTQHTNTTLAHSMRGNIPSFLVMESLTEANHYAAKHNADMVHLSLGQPGKPVPRRVAEKLSALVLEDKLGYTEACGMQALRERIAAFYEERYGLSINPQRVFVTLGSSAAFFLTLLAAFDVGDRVALIEPTYPAYRNVLTAMGLKPELLRGSFANNFQPTIEMLEALEKSPEGLPKGLIISSPSNPTGTVLSAERLQAIVTFCKARNVTLISDEIYHGMTYDGIQAECALSHDDNAIIINSFSKYFLMPGWRLGWVIAPEPLQRSYESLLQSFFVSPSAFAQHAALEVFNCTEELDATVQEYAENRRILLEQLPQIGFSHLCPAEGAFYIYADISSLSNDSVDFCRRMMQEAHVVAVSGHDFDTREGSRFIRMSYAGTKADIELALARMGKWLK